MLALRKMQLSGSKLNQNAAVKRVNARHVSQHYMEEHLMCVSLPVTQNEQPRGCLVQIKFQQGVNSHEKKGSHLIKLPCMVMYLKLHANTMQMQKN